MTDAFFFFFFFQAEDGIRDAQESRGLGDVYKRQPETCLINNGDHAHVGSVDFQIYFQEKWSQQTPPPLLELEDEHTHKTGYMVCVRNFGRHCVCACASVMGKRRTTTNTPS
eukprot:TRINITY_DN23832_c0_g1_i4.p1 TRINITY_DN23832_c0_g1~~TRINITY_DN23832_c0_g1_i4.p1  ORF type:complete len:112 (-),score=29.55 TRINITY_DN23832_c0_g1_i4:591-926(-)